MSIERLEVEILFVPKDNLSIFCAIINETIFVFAKNNKRHYDCAVASSSNSILK